MAREKKNESTLTLEAKLAQAVIPDWEWPYKVPENWCWTTVGHLCSFVGGGTPDKANPAYWNGNIPWASVKDIKGDRLYDTIDHITQDGLERSASNLCKKNELILVTRIEPGKAIISETVTAINQDLKVVKSKLSADFLYRYFQTFQRKFEEKASGSTVKGITVPNVQRTAFPLPPLAEQQRIVDRIESLFAKLDEAKEKAQSVLDSFETRKAAILHKAFTGELTAKWRAEHGRDKREWQQGRIIDFCIVNPKKASTKDLPDDLDVSFVPMPALSDVLGEITTPQVKKLKDVRTGFTSFAEGDVVFAKITPCMENGKSAVVGSLVNGIGFGTTEFFVFRCSEKLLNRYLYHLLRSQAFRKEAKAVMTGAVGQQRVPKSFLEEYPLLLPSVPEQIEIVRILDSLFAKEQQAKETAEAVLEQIDLMKKSILARAFRGELGTNDPTEESAVKLLKSVLAQ